MKTSKIESGRSMVEMLGVLAIIGVLSVGGIAGYQQAMKQHKVNEMNNAIRMMMVEVKAAAESGASNNWRKSMVAGGVSVAGRIYYRNDYCNGSYVGYIDVDGPLEIIAQAQADTDYVHLWPCDYAICDYNGGAIGEYYLIDAGSCTGEDYGYPSFYVK